MYGECWFTGNFYFKHGGSQNATLRQLANLFLQIYVTTASTYFKQMFLRACISHLTRGCAFLLIHRTCSL